MTSYFQDDGCVISRRKVLPSGECIGTVFQRIMLPR